MIKVATAFDREVDAGPTRRAAVCGPSGWIGAGLDANADWTEIAEPLRDGYRLIAPTKLLALLDDTH